MPEATAEAWRNGWFHTGDAFRCDEEGWYYFVDRMKDAIRRRGENISAFEVENFVIEHPTASPTAPPSACRAEFGEDEVMVVVVVTDGVTFTRARARSRCSSPACRGSWCPRYVDVMDDLPRNETSLRVRKFELRQRGVTATTWDRETAGVERQPPG